MPYFTDDIAFVGFYPSTSLYFVLIHSAVLVSFTNIEDCAIRPSKSVDVVFVFGVVLGYSVHGKGDSLSSLGMLRTITQAPHIYGLSIAYIGLRSQSIALVQFF